MSLRAMRATFALRVKGLSSTDRLVLLALANYADAEADDCFPSYRTLMEDTGLARRTVIGSVASLERLGLLVRRHRVRKDGSSTSNVFKLPFVADFEGGPADAPPLGKGAGEAPEGEADAPLEPVSYPYGFSSSFHSEEKPETTRAREQRLVPGESAKPARLGSRLPQDWLPEAADIEWAVDLFSGQLDWIAARRVVDDELEKFRDYWVAVPGAKGRKLDWRATWRNWIRRASEDRAGRRGMNGKRYRNPALAAADYFRAIDGE